MTRLQAIERLQAADPVASFMVCDVDEANGYFGYMTMTGAWMIKKFTGSVMRYAFGVDDYQAQWALRTTLTYLYPNE